MFYAGRMAFPPPPAAQVSSIPTITPRIVSRLPHDPAAFTEGLELSGGVLYESSGLDGVSGLARLDPRTGQTLQNRAPALPHTFAEGVSVLNKRVYQLTWKDQTVVVYDAATLRPLTQLSYGGEGWGLSNDGKALIMSNGSDTLTWRRPQDFKVLRAVKVTAAGQPIDNLNELEYAGGQIYANVWLTNRIARIDPQSGAVTAWIDLSALSREAAAEAAKRGQTLGQDDVANGIAYDLARRTFLLTGKRWPITFEVRLDAPARQ